MIAQEWGRLDSGSAMAVPNAALKDSIASHGAIARLIRHAIEGLSEPPLAAVQAAATMLREAQAESQGFAVNQRYARDTAAAILRAAVTGEIPRTWSHE